MSFGCLFVPFNHENTSAMRGFGMNQLNYTHRHDGKEPTRKQTKRVHDVHALALFLAASQLFFVGLRRRVPGVSDFAVILQFWCFGAWVGGHLAAQILEARGHKKERTQSFFFCLWFFLEAS